MSKQCLYKYLLFDKEAAKLTRLQNIMTRFFRLHCQEPWFSLLESGKKCVEGRRNSANYQKIKQGDQIEFYCKNDFFKAQVIEVKKYKTLDEYLIAETVPLALPGIKTMDEARRIYLQWNSEREINKDGFLGIHIKVI